ncbi:hypothetical protein SEVIR_3G332751v4 [Setaria viridis]
MRGRPTHAQGERPPSRRRGGRRRHPRRPRRECTLARPLSGPQCRGGLRPRKELQRRCRPTGRRSSPTASTSRSWCSGGSGGRGGIVPSNLQAHLSSAARADIELLDGAIAAVSLTQRLDGRWLRGASSNSARAGNFALLHTPVGGPPMSDINWDCYAPKKVEIFFWVLRHGRMHSYAGAAPSPWRA